MSGWVNNLNSGLVWSDRLLVHPLTLNYNRNKLTHWWIESHATHNFVHVFAVLCSTKRHASVGERSFHSAAGAIPVLLSHRLDTGGIAGKGLRQALIHIVLISHAFLNIAELHHIYRTLLESCMLGLLQWIFISPRIPGKLSRIWYIDRHRIALFWMLQLYLRVSVVGN